MTPPPLSPIGPEELRKLDIRAPWAFGMEDRVRFYELDSLNHVNNTAYLRWFETTRVHYMAEYDISYYRPQDPTLVLRAITCDFHAPMFLNESYVVTARCRSFRNTSFVKEYAVWSEGQIKVNGTAVVVMTDDSGTKKMPIPEKARRIFGERDGAEALT